MASFSPLLQSQDQRAQGKCARCFFFTRAVEGGLIKLFAVFAAAQRC